MYMWHILSSNVGPTCDIMQCTCGIYYHVMYMLHILSCNVQ